MIDREEMYRMLQEHPEQQDLLDYVTTEIAKAVKADFPAYLKMVQMDVAKAVMDGAEKDNMVGDKLPELTAALDELMQQVCTDTEDHLRARYRKEKADLDRIIPG